MPCRCVARRRLAGALCLLLLWTALSIDGPAARAQGKPRPGNRTAQPPRLNLPPLKTPEDKLRLLETIRQTMSTTRIGGNIRYGSPDLDKSLESSIGLEAGRYAPIIGDEAFVRRVSLDLTGEPPSPRAIQQFIADPDPRKRSRLIDELLETEAYARKWARYWRQVVLHNSPANRRRLNPQALEDWLTAQFHNNVPWDRIVAEMVSATPRRDPSKKDDYGQNHGPNNFVLAYENKAPELASQTARLFMGISIGCAECHDHPFEDWKREQFHELAAFFAPGRYRMADQHDPEKETVMQPVFLLGEKPPENMNADARRVALAAYLIYNPDNYWFARAYVNRVWNELLGDGFYAVDSLGPDQDCVHKLVVNRIAAMFRYRNFDSKWLFRLAMNSRAYQRDIRPVESPSELFTAMRPSRLRPDGVAASVKHVLNVPENLNRQIERTFAVDPSIPQDDIEGSLQQALLFMNNRELQTRLANSELTKRLVAMKSNERMVDELYLGVLARTPTESEQQRAARHLRTVGNRQEAIEDLVWVLVNSTE
ncbi:MAG TPA: DUF1549 domain-containing protein, partial [Planctomycetaceae bacterium]|nr:DUF1549 domain-containing protein [Planctomycetaceae bacterium]